MAKIAAIILAGGTSTRFGANKLVTPVSGKPLIRYAVEAAIASVASRVIVVTGHDAEAVTAALAGLAIDVVHNSDYARGLSASLKCGVAAVPDDCDGAAVLLGDMPYVKPLIIDRLIAMFAPGEGRAIGVPVLAGRAGHPVLWAREFFPEILALEGDRGAKLLMDRHKDRLYRLDVADSGIHFDIDTPEDL